VVDPLDTLLLFDLSSSPRSVIRASATSASPSPSALPSAPHARLQPERLYEPSGGKFRRKPEHRPRNRGAMRGRTLKGAKSLGTPRRNAYPIRSTHWTSS